MFDSELLHVLAFIRKPSSS